MEAKKRWDLAAATFIILLGLAVFYRTLTRFVKAQAVGGGPFANSAFYPQVIAGIMILLAVLLIVATLSKKSGAREEKSERPGADPLKAAEEKPAADQGALADRPGKITLLLVAFVLIAYTVLLELFGYFLTTPVMMIVLQRMLKVRSWILTILIAAAATLVWYAFFSTVLDVIFPPGRWNPFIR